MNLACGKNKTLSASELRSLLSYEQSNGAFTWIVAPSNRIRAGSEAGSVGRLGYRRICINRRAYFAHRLAWLYVYGRWPLREIDHIDGTPANNAIANLREADHFENQANRGRQKNNTSGYKGVHFNRQAWRWRAVIHAGGCTFHLGSFKTRIAAAKAYARAARRLHCEFGRTA